MMTVAEALACADIPAVAADHDGLITGVNPSFEAVFGWSAAELAGRPLTVLIPRSMHDSHHLGFSRFLTTGRATLLGRPLKLRAVAKDGREFDCEHFIVAEERGGRWTFAATMRPLPGA